MGSGIKCVPLAKLAEAVGHIFEAVGPAGLKIATRVVPLAQISGVWEEAGGKPRVVFTVG